MTFHFSLEVLKGISFDWKSIVAEILVFGKTGKVKRVSGSDINWSLTPKFPACQTVELDHYFDLDNLTPETVMFYFNKTNNLAVDMYLEEKEFLVKNRKLKTSLFSYSGPKITIEDLDSITDIEMFFKVVQKLDSDLDKTKNCTNYPNEMFKSYKECDKKFVHEKMKQEFGIMPFWATDDLNEVTNMR